jgi:hypothetical protein
MVGPQPKIAVPTPEPVAAESRFARHPAAFVLASVGLLIPCFWQSRLQAGDLSSHLYNAWLAQLIERDQAPGLSTAFQATNVLFDLLLKALFGALGAGPAQRIAVAFCVLVFAWGAFAFVSKVSGRLAWRMLPWIAVLSYGWVFHIGFFNFYLSLGICFWALSMAWNLEVPRMRVASALLVVAYIAHGLPVVWSIVVLAYVWTARRIDPVRQSLLLGGAVLAIVVLRLVLSATMLTRWYGRQITLIGFDQAWVFDEKYLIVTMLGLTMSTLWFARLTERRSLPLQVCLLTAAGIYILPTAVLIPGYKHLLVYIAERMSLALAVCMLAALGAAVSRTWDRYLTIGAVILFFAFLYRDEGRLNSFEDRIDAAVAQIPERQRVIAGFDHPGLRVNALAHMIDRACVGRCYSYSNSEPSTAQFHVRVTGPTPIVAATYKDSFDMQTGTYVVKESDLPLYQLLGDEQGNIQIRIPPPGRLSGATAWKGF